MSITRPQSRWPEFLFQSLTRMAGIFILTLVAGLVSVLVYQSMPVLEKAGQNGLFTSTNWQPKPPAGGTVQFGSLAFVWGTVSTSIIAMLLAVPLGVASAAYLSEIASPSIRKIGSFLIELLAAIPSVVYGFWGLFFLAPLIQKLFDALGGANTGGNGILAAGVILAIMILPYITAISFDVCQSVPRSQREGSLALGATHWQTIWHAVLPYARPGIFAASFLALGRALGETMAVTMLIGNKEEVRFSIFALGDSIASRIANQLTEADEPEFRSALIALALVLMVVTAVFNLFARFLLHQISRQNRGKATPRIAKTANATPGEDMPNFKPRMTEVAKPRPLDPLPHSTASRTWNRVMITSLLGCFVVTVTPLFLILGYISYRGSAAIERSLFLDRGKPPLNDVAFEQYQKWRARETTEYPMDEFDRPVSRGGLGHAMLGSLLIVSVATICAVPISLLAAVYLAETRRSKLASTVRFMTELLGGVPSIVVGMFAYALLVVPNYALIFGPNAQPLGLSAWAGAFALAVMMVPIIVRSAEESMKLVPDSIRQASYALGANRMQTTLFVTLPAALPAIVTGIFLAVGRIAGETAPLLLTAGNSVFWPTSPTKPTAFLPGYIYSYSRSQYLDWQDQAWGGALVLLVVVMVLNIGIRLFAGQRMVAASRAD